MQLRLLWLLNVYWNLIVADFSESEFWINLLNDITTLVEDDDDRQFWKLNDFVVFSILGKEILQESKQFSFSFSSILYTVQRTVLEFEVVFSGTEMSETEYKWNSWTLS